MYIDREDMLELTRRMTVSRNCFGRIAGAYMDEESSSMRRVISTVPLIRIF